MMAIRMESFNGDGDVYGEAMIIRNGKIETPSRIGNERGDDGSRTLFLDASSWGRDHGGVRVGFARRQGRRRDIF